MPTAEKEQYVEDLREDLESTTGVYLCNFRGISAEEMNELRGAVLDSGGRIQIIKNRLMKIAIEGTSAEGLDEYLTGPTALAFCAEDPVSQARVMQDFADDLEPETQTWQVKAAWIEDRVLEAEEAQAMAEMPTMDELKASIVGTISSPADALVRTLNAAVSDLVFTLDAIAEEREEDAA